MSDSHRLVLVRHGQTEWSRTGRHTGLTDVDLTAEGERQARALAPALLPYRGCPVWSSPLTRARRTAELAGLRDVEVTDDLLEWDYGGYEGLTTAQIRGGDAGSGWTVFSDGVVPGDTPGESLQQVTTRARRVLDHARTVLDSSNLVLVGHGHALRVLAACWVDADPTFGARLILAAGSVSVLGSEHDVAGILSWNASAVGELSPAAGPPQ
ncbi:MAG TPA: histidine phosphatase family protein [Actinomycetales bacterium]|nr:histidine phosphatase family protein [Actinomycetales bacterium]